jgi:hypothetical protein
MLPPSSATAEFDLARVPDSFTDFFLSARPDAWKRFYAQRPKRKSVEEAIQVRIARSVSRSADPTIRAILDLLFDPAVAEFMLARWPSRHVLGIERPLWMAGFECEDPEEAGRLVRTFVQTCGPIRWASQTRTFAGRKVMTISPQGRNLHILADRNHFLITPSLSLLRDYLSRLAEPPEPPEPPTTLPPDAAIGWRLGRREGDKEEAPLSGFLHQAGVEHVEVSLQESPLGLEIRLSAKGSPPPGSGQPFRPPDLELLDSIPSGSDLILAGGGLDLLGVPGGRASAKASFAKKPFALGVQAEEDIKVAPTRWKVGGALASSTVSITDLPDDLKAAFPAAARVPQATPEPPPTIDPLGLGWTSRYAGDRLLFGNTDRPPGPEPIDETIGKRLADLAANALLIGVLSPRMLALPAEWENLLEGAGEVGEGTPVREWYSEAAPLEFSLVRVPSGFEVRLLSQSPVSHLLFFADALFLLNLDYAGEWDALAQHWENAESPVPEPRPQIPEAELGGEEN